MGRLNAEDAHPPLSRRSEAHESAQRRCLAGPVTAEQRGDLAFRDFKTDAVEDMALAIIGVEIFGNQRGGHAALPR